MAVQSPDDLADRGPDDIQKLRQPVRQAPGRLDDHAAAVGRIVDSARHAGRLDPVEQPRGRRRRQPEALSQLASVERTVEVEDVERLIVGGAEPYRVGGGEVEGDDRGEVAPVVLGEGRRIGHDFFVFSCTRATIDSMQIDYQFPEAIRQQDDTEIRASLERMVAAWDAGDAAAFAAEFTSDATYVIYVGLVYQGRAAIESGHIPVFQKWQKGTRMSMLVRSVRTIGEGTAVVLTEGG